MTTKTSDAAARIREFAALVQADAHDIDTSRTEDIVAGNLDVGDVVTSIGAVEFPFPFTLTQVQTIRGHLFMRAMHGWFNVTPIRPDEACVRVLLSA